MFTSHNRLTATISLATILCAYLAANMLHANAQQASQTTAVEKASAIQLYNQRDTKGSVKALRAFVKQNKDDAEAWYYLGLSLRAENRIKDARQAFEKSVKLRPNFIDAQTALAFTLLAEGKREEAGPIAERVLQTDAGNAEAHYVLGNIKIWKADLRGALAEAEKALATRPDFAHALFLKADAVRRIISKEFASATTEQRAAFVSLSKEAIAGLESALKQRQDKAASEKWELMLITLRPYAEGNFDDIAYRSSDVTKKARILARPTPQVNFWAQGMVSLQLVLRRDGEVDNIHVISKTDERLVKPCIEAARNIQFAPAMKDGRAVSQYVRVEYYFN